MISENDWVEYRALVLNELKRLNQHISDCDDNMREEVGKAKTELAEKIDKLSDKQQAMDKEVAQLRTKMVIFGSLAASVVSYLIDILKT